MDTLKGVYSTYIIVTHEKSLVCPPLGGAGVGRGDDQPGHFHVATGHGRHRVGAIAASPPLLSLPDPQRRGGAAFAALTREVVSAEAQTKEARVENAATFGQNYENCRVKNNLKDFLRNEISFPYLLREERPPIRHSSRRYCSKGTSNSTPPGVEGRWPTPTARK